MCRKSKLVTIKCGKPNDEPSILADMSGYQP